MIDTPGGGRAEAGAVFSLHTAAASGAARAAILEI